MSSSIRDIFNWFTASPNSILPNSAAEKQKENSQEAAIKYFTGAIEALDFNDEKVKETYSGLVTDLELALFSALAYKSAEEHTMAEQLLPKESNDYRLRWWHILHKNGWRVFQTEVGEQGFRATAYIHDGRKQVVMAFRGTEPKEPVTFWIDWEEVVKMNIGSHGQQAWIFAQNTLLQLETEGKPISSTEIEIKPESYQITFTGHSLGAWLASVASSVLKYPGVVFDSPGAAAIVERYREGDTEKPGAILLTNYLAQPNLINTAQQYIIGCHSLQLTTAAPSRVHKWTDISAEIEYSLAQHSIDLLVATFDPNTGMPQQGSVKTIKKWPHNGAEAAKKIAAVLPPELKNSVHLICRWYFAKDVSYSEWAGLFIKLASTIPNLKKENLPQLIASVFNTITEVYAATDCDYLRMDTSEPKSLEAAFNQRFKSHYEVLDDFDLQSLPIICFTESTLAVIRDIKKYRKQGVIFPQERSYLNEIELHEGQHIRDGSKERVYIPATTGKTAVDCRREIMKSLPKLKAYLEPYKRNIIDRTRLKYEVPVLIGDQVVQRTRLLDQITNAFERKDKQSEVKIATVFALGGMGKTHLAKQFANKAYKEGRYQAVIWLDAENDLFSAYQQLAITLLGEQQVIGVEQKIWQPKLKRRLQESYGSTLFIFDGVHSCDAVDLYLQKLPATTVADVLITTRNNEAYKQYDRIPAESFNLDEARDYIRLNLADYDVSDEDAKNLAEAVDGHPLSLSYLVGYIRTNHISVIECLKRYEQQEVGLLLEAMQGHINEEQGRAMLLSLEQLTHQSELACQILDVCAFLSAEDISKELLKAYFDDVDEKTLGNALKILTQSSLLTPVRGKPGYYHTHRLLQDVARYQLKQMLDKFEKTVEKLLIFFENRLQKTAAKLTSPEVNSLDKEVIRQEHIQAKFLCHRLKKETLTTEMQEKYACLLFRLGYCFNETIRYAEARVSYEHALEIRIKIYGTDEHPAVADCLLNLGNVFYREGRYAKARKHYQQALDIGRKIYGIEEHPNVADSLFGLGNTSFKEGQYPKAKEYYKQALDLRRRIYDTDEHIKITDCLLSLGNIFYSLDRYTRARKHYQQALDIRRKIYGTDEHFTIADCLVSLGNVFYQEGHYAKASTHYQQALDIYKKIYGTYEHHKVVACLANIGNVFHRDSQYANARAYYQQVLDIEKKIYGTDEHPQIADSLVHLGNALYSEDQYVGARAYYQQALDIYKKVYGTDEHPKIAACLVYLGDAFCDDDQYADARRCYQQALDIGKKIYSTNEHSTIADCWVGLGKVFDSENRYAEAKACYQQALAIGRKVYNTNGHPKIAACLVHLGNVSAREGRYAEAREYYEEALDIRRKSHGTDLHSEIANVLMLLGRVELRMGNKKEACEDLWNAYSIFLKILGDTHPLTQRAKAILEENCPDGADDELNKGLIEKVVGSAKAEELFPFSASPMFESKAEYQHLFSGGENKNDTNDSQDIVAPLLLGGTIATTYAAYRQQQYQSQEHTSRKAYPPHGLPPEVGGIHRAFSYGQQRMTTYTANYRTPFHFFSHPTLSWATRFGGHRTGALLGGVMVLGATFYGGWKMMQPEQKESSTTQEKRGPTLS